MTIDPPEGKAGDARGYRDRLFEEYGHRVEQLDPERPAKVSWFRDYLQENYSSVLPHRDQSGSAIADIGCSRGYLLEALHDMGYRGLVGVDVSPIDVVNSRLHLPSADIQLGDGSAFLSSNGQTFDVIILRAVLEHTLKPDVIPLLEACRHALKPAGVLIIDVPNMDWLFSGHERYMDFTHEVGFTRESLMQVMTVVFPQVEIRLVDHRSPRERQAWRSRLGRAVLGRLLRWSDSEGADNPIWARNLVAFGRLGK